MSDNQIIAYIRQRRALEKIWNGLTVPQRRQVLAELDNDVWHIEEVLENISEEV